MNFISYYNIIGCSTMIFMVKFSENRMGLNPFFLINSFLKYIN